MATRVNRRPVALIAAGLIIVFSSTAADAVRGAAQLNSQKYFEQMFKEHCAEAAKSARTSGEKIHLRLNCDRSLYSNVKYSVHGEVLSLKIRPDGTTEVIVGKMRTVSWQWDQQSRSQELRVPADKPFPGIATLVWRDKDRPVPLAIGMSISVGIDSQKIVRAFSYAISRLVAVRKRMDGFWEELIQVSTDNHPQQPLLILFANHTDLDGPDENGGETDIEWNEVLGLCKGYWSECGGGEAEKEGISSELHGRGWAPVNSPRRIRPGRDGWIRFDKLDRIENDGKNLVPPAQFLKDSC